MLTPDQEQRITDWQRAKGLPDACPICHQAAGFNHDLGYSYNAGDHTFAYVRLERMCRHCGVVLTFDVTDLNLVTQDDLSIR